jgi:hypothetical protein
MEINMLSYADIEKRGGQVAAGKVILDGKFVEGIWTEDGFSPAQGSAFDPKLADKAGKRRAAVSEATDVEVK